MNISEMHVWFRQYAQQMGMQNVKAILPEQIDLLINTSIVDTVNQIIAQTIGVTNDRILSDNSKIGQINALKPLYKIATLNMFGVGTILKADVDWIAMDTTPKVKNVNIEVKGKTYSLSFSINGGQAEATGQTSLAGMIYTSNLTEASQVMTDAIISARIPGISDAQILCYKGALNVMHLAIDIRGTEDIKVTTSSSQGGGSSVTESSRAVSMFRLTTDNITKGMLFASEVNIPYMYLVDFALDYKVAAVNGAMSPTTTGVIYEDGGFVSKYYPVRLVDDAMLADTLNDYILSPRPRSPILTVNANTFDLYFGDFIQYGNGYSLENHLVPYTLRVSYIAKPATVKYAHDIGGTDINCDLPDYLHIDILKHAVDLWRNSVGAQGPMLNDGQQPQRGNNPNNESYNS